MPSLLQVAHQLGPKNVENCENGPKWVAMARYEPILRESEATPSLNPLACLPSPESPKILENPKNPGILEIPPIPAN